MNSFLCDGFPGLSNVNEIAGWTHITPAIFFLHKSDDKKLRVVSILNSALFICRGLRLTTLPRMCMMVSWLFHSVFSLSSTVVF